MGIRLLALFEVIRTLAEAGEEIPGPKLDKVVDELSRVYSKVFRDDLALVESFSVVKDSLKEKPPTDEDEAIIRMVSSMLSRIEEKYGLSEEAEEAFYRSISRNLGPEFTSLVRIFENAIREEHGD